MKSSISHHNHNTSGHSLRKFRNTKYFQDQRGYETDYMKKRNDNDAQTTQQKKAKNKFDDQVDEYLRKVGSGCTGESMVADENKNIDYASEVETKIKTLEAKHLASSVIFKQLSHCHSDLMNLHNVKLPSANQTMERTVNKSLENSHRASNQRQNKSQSNLTITSTPYKSPSFQNKKSTKSMQFQSKPGIFNQTNNGDTFSQILESSLDKLDEEDIAENISIKEKILDSLNEQILHEDEDFDDIHLDGTDEHQEVYLKKGKQLQKEINNQSSIMNPQLDDSYNDAMQDINESDTLSISQKLVLLGSNIKSKNHLKDESQYYLPQSLKTPSKNPNELHNNLYNNMHNNSHQNFIYTSPQNNNRFLSPNSTQKKTIGGTAQINFHHNNRLDQNKQKYSQNQLNMGNGQSKNSTTYQNQYQSLSSTKNKQQTQAIRQKQMPSTAREINKNGEHQNQKITQNSRSRQNSQKRSPSRNKNSEKTAQSSSQKIEKFYASQVERQNDVVSQQQKQISQYQQQLQQQSLDFQLFMQEQQLLQQQQYFQQQQQLMQQQRLSIGANLFLQNPLSPNIPTTFSPNILMQNPLLGQQQLYSPFMIPGQQPSSAGTHTFIPQVHPPIIINNNIQKKDFEEQSEQNNQNGVNNQQNTYSKSAKNVSQSLQSPINNGSYDRGADETLTPNAAQQGIVDNSQQTFERQTEQLFKNNNNNSSYGNGGNGLKRLSSQRRKWDIQKTGTQSELSADEDFLTQYSREIKQPRQFEPISQQIVPGFNQQQQPPQRIVKKPVKFEIFWERDEIEQENKENQRNNSNKLNEESKLESTIQKQYKNAIDQADNSAAGNGKLFEKIFGNY